jgi:hypothetical protein
MFLRNVGSFSTEYMALYLQGTVILSLLENVYGVIRYFVLLPSSWVKARNLVKPRIYASNLAFVKQY